MRISMRAIVICVSAAVLAGCGGHDAVIPTQTQIGNQLEVPHPPNGGSDRWAPTFLTPGVTYAVLHSFGGSGDGATPGAALINVMGTLYSTTAKGGANDGGTVFSIKRGSGKERVLHSFGGSGDGANPEAGLLNFKGTLYGTTESGGANGTGTVFSFKRRSRKETLLHSFGGSGDGVDPEAGLIYFKGTLYGTTYYGGANNRGTVFAITPSGSEIVLHSFGGSGDGKDPNAALINFKGTLYGTTAYGGANERGTVFSITPSGSETVLHSFGGSGDGAHPIVGLVNFKRTFYGTTFYGGANNHGTVFAITPSGSETLLYSFGGSGDGTNPWAGLIVVSGTLYGTTNKGGTNDHGTVFAITPSGSETVLHSFGGSGDGARPAGDLINVKGTLYGTTAEGGANKVGTIFSLTP